MAIFFFFYSSSRRRLIDSISIRVTREIIQGGGHRRSLYILPFVDDSVTMRKNWTAETRINNEQAI